MGSKFEILRHCFKGAIQAQLYVSIIVSARIFPQIPAETATGFKRVKAGINNELNVHKWILKNKFWVEIKLLRKDEMYLY